MEAPIRRSPYVATALVLAVLASALVALVPGRAAAQIPYPDTQRLSAGNAVAAGIAVSKRLYANGAAESVVLTRQDTFPDGLAAAGVAGQFNGPVLFTASSSLTAATETELRRVLQADANPKKRVFLMGGTNALSQSIEDRLKGDYNVVRFAGTDRADTAALAALGAVRTGPDATAIVVRAYGSPGQDTTEGWVDAISCGAYAADNGTPILLTNTQSDQVSGRTLDALDQLNVQRVIICGGFSAVPKSHSDQLLSLGYGVDRYAGTTRIGTATDVAQRLWAYNSTQDKDFLLVNGWGSNFAYGIAAAPLGAALDAPLLLVNNTTPSAYDPDNCPNPADFQQETLCYLSRRGNSRISSLTLIGSTSLVNDTVFAAAAEAGGLPKDTKPPTVPAKVTATDTPEDDGTKLNVAWDASTDDTGGSITYTVYYRTSSSDAFTTDGEGVTKAGTVTNKTTFTVSKLTEDTSYDVAVTATDQFGNTSDVSAKATATPTDEVPAGPENAPNVANQPGPAVVVSWLEAPEADVAGYKVERATPGTLTGNCETGLGGASYTQIAQVDGRATTSYRDEDVEAGDELCYRYRKFDTTGNNSEASPGAPITVNTVTSDTTPPAGTPSFYAVNYDQEEGLIGGSSAASRTEKSANRFDVVVPAGAYANGEGGKVLLYVDGENRQEEGFVATGAEQIVSVPFTFDADETSAQLETTLADADGNESPKSAAWSLTIDRQQGAPETPRIVLVDGTSTDPLDFEDQRIPVVGGDTPRVNPRPVLEVDGLNPMTTNAQVVRIYQQGVLIDSKCYDQDPNSSFPAPPSNGEAVFNPPGESDVTMVTGTNNLVATITTRTACSGSLARDIALSGDSNTAKYVYNASSFGVADSFPRAGASDINSYADATEFTVTFNKPAASGSLVSLRPVGGSAIASTTLSSSSETITVTKPSTFGPGSWELVVDATAADNASQTTDVTIPFFAGFVHQTSVSAAISVDTNEPNWDDTNSSTNPFREDYELTFVVAPSAPTGRYEVFNAADDSTLMTLDHTAGTETRDGDKSVDPANFDEDNQGFEWTYKECLPDSPDATKNCDNPQLTTTAKQPDGTLPNKLTADQLGQLGLRQHTGNAFRFNGSDGLANRSYDWELVYRPASLGDSDVFNAPGQVIRTQTGAQGVVDNAAVRSGWAVFYYVRDLESGNESDLVLDGSLRGLSTVFPTNGLGNTEGSLQAGDSLILDFGSAKFSGTLADDNTVDAGLQIFSGSGDAQKQIEPHFEAGATSASSASRDFADETRIVISFGSATTLGGNAVPQPSSAPTSVHGGVSVIGLNWAVDTEFGHVVLLPDNSSPRSTNSTF